MTLFKQFYANKYINISSLSWPQFSARFFPIFANNSGDFWKNAKNDVKIDDQKQRGKNHNSTKNL